MAALKLFRHLLDERARTLFEILIVGHVTKLFMYGSSILSSLLAIPVFRYSTIYNSAILYSVFKRLLSTYCTWALQLVLVMFRYVFTGTYLNNEK